VLVALENIIDDFDCSLVMACQKKGVQWSVSGIHHNDRLADKGKKRTDLVGVKSRKPLRLYGISK
jgi:hypothetical protein